MKWIGQHIYDLIARFRSDIYLEDLAEQDQEFSVMIDADGKLTKSSHPGERSRIQVRNDEGSTIPAGAPLYSKGEIGGSERILVGICVSSDPTKMPCIGVAEFEMNTTDTKDSFAVTQGVYNTNISGFTGLSVGDTLYVNGGVAPHLTQTKPTNGDLIQNVGIVLKTNGTICQGLLVSAIGRTNDVPWPLYVDHTNQRVGIGTTSPAYKLDVAGTAQIQAATSAYLTFEQSSNQYQAAINSSNHLVLQAAFNNQVIFKDGGATNMVIDGTTSNVGIGTTTPTSKLHVVGDARIQGNLTVNGTYTQIDTDVNTTEQWLVTNDGTGPAAVINQLGTEDIFDVQDDGTSVFYIEDGGQIGIGTTSPTSKLQVDGTTFINNGILKIAKDSVTNYYEEDQMNSYGTFYNWKFAGTTVMHINSSGSIGIGTTNPSAKLDVNGSANFGGNTITSGRADFQKDIRLRGTDALANQGVVRFYVDSSDKLFIDTANDGSNLFAIDSSGNVGIGTTSPSYKLDVDGEILSDGLRLNLSATTQRAITSIGTDSIQIGDAGVNEFKFKNTAGTSMMIAASGNVGIGTTSPSEKLEVDGNIKIGDSDEVRLGAGNDLRIYHNGTNSNIENFTGTLQIVQTVDDEDITFRCDDGSGGTTPYITIDGSATRTNVHKDLRFDDNIGAVFGSGAALKLHSDGSNGIIDNFQGNLIIRQQVDDADIAFQCDDGSGGVETYFFLDGGSVATQFNKNTLHPDGVRARFGSSADMYINHDGTNSYIENETGNLYILNRSDDKDIVLQSDDGSGGLATYLQLDGSSVRTRAFKDVNFDDSVKATFGASSDLQIYHDGSNSYIKDGGTGSLYTLTNAYRLTNAAGNENMIWAEENSFVKLYYNNSAKLETTSTGVEVTGNISLTGSVQKQIQVFPMNFVDDLGTDKHFMPFVTNVEQTVVYQEEAAMVMPADGRVVSVTVHYAQMDGTDGNITVGIETSACGQSYANPWTVEETETIAASVADDHHVFHFAFDNAKHFESTDKMAISIQQSTDMQSAGRFFWVTAVIEYDWSTFLGGTSAEYTTTP